MNSRTAVNVAATDVENACAELEGLGDELGVARLATRSQKLDSVISRIELRVRLVADELRCVATTMRELTGDAEQDGRQQRPSEVARKALAHIDAVRGIVQADVVGGEQRVAACDHLINAERLIDRLVHPIEAAGPAINPEPPATRSRRARSNEDVAGRTVPAARDTLPSCAGAQEVA